MCRVEGRTWYTAHRGRLWIAAAAKNPTPQEISEVEAIYRHIYKKGAYIVYWKTFVTSLICFGLKRCKYGASKEEKCTSNALFGFKKQYINIYVKNALKSFCMAPLKAVITTLVVSFVIGLCVFYCPTVALLLKGCRAYLSYLFKCFIVHIVR